MKVVAKSSTPLRKDNENELQMVAQDSDKEFVISSFADHYWNGDFYVPLRTFGLGLDYASIIHKQYKNRWNVELLCRFHKKLINDRGTWYWVTMIDHHGFTKAIEALARTIMSNYPGMILYHTVGEQGKMFLKIAENTKHGEGFESKIEVLESNPDNKETFDFVAYTRIVFYVSRVENRIGYILKTKSIKLG